MYVYVYGMYYAVVYMYCSPLIYTFLLVNIIVVFVMKVNSALS